jgi:osmoprotectant transport system permease protein
MNWVSNNVDLIIELTGSHLVISLIPVLLGLVISVPLGWVPGFSTRST